MYVEIYENIIQIKKHNIILKSIVIIYFLIIVYKIIYKFDYIPYRNCI